MPVEQAIFTSCRRHGAEGYQLASASPGLTSEDARALAAWGPSHDALLPDEPAASLNCHRLPRGAVCVSRTLAAGPEFSGRAATRIYTHFLVLDEDTWHRFACRPLAILRAALAQGHLDPHDVPPDALPACHLPGRAAVLEPDSLQGLPSDLLRRGLPALLAALASEPAVGIVAPRPLRKPLADALCQCLPLARRASLTQTTGLRPSPRRPFQLQFLSAGASRSACTTVIDVLAPPDPAALRHADWSAPLAAAVARGDLTSLAAQLAAVPAARAPLATSP